MEIEKISPIGMVLGGVVGLGSGITDLNFQSFNSTLDSIISSSVPALITGATMVAVLKGRASNIIAVTATDYILGYAFLYGLVKYANQLF